MLCLARERRATQSDFGARTHAVHMIFVILILGCPRLPTVVGFHCLLGQFFLKILQRPRWTRQKGD